MCSILCLRVQFSDPEPGNTWKGCLSITEDTPDVKESQHGTIIFEVREPDHQENSDTALANINFRFFLPGSEELEENEKLIWPGKISSSSKNSLEEASQTSLRLVFMHVLFCALVNYKSQLSRRAVVVTNVKKYLYSDVEVCLTRIIPKQGKPPVEVSYWVAAYDSHTQTETLTALGAVLTGTSS